MSSKTNTNQNQGDQCWKCDCCNTINKLQLSKQKYDLKCYGCKSTKYIINKTPIIHSLTWDKPGHFLSKFQDEIDEECNSFPKDMNETINNMNVKNKLLVTGYFRKHNINVPESIIQYCIIYLFLKEDLYIGNLHSLSHVWHVWTMFISSSKYKLTKPISIQQVTYNIHKSYKRNIITVQKSPFYLKRRARGCFEVEAKIEFKKEYNRKDIIYYHDLNYNHYATLTHIEEDKMKTAKIGYEYYFKHDGIHYDDPNQFIIKKKKKKK